MRFLDLRLLAYGPFTDHRLDLAGGDQGLHIVYGPNEAGKSASLRAIGSLLYGIDPRCPDKFVHPYPDLRVGAHLRHSSGEEEVFVRRKGSKNTLLDRNGHPVADHAITKYLAVEDGRLFELLYGINHKTLLDGGREMKNLKGRIGETLFSAGLGAGVNDLLNRLAEEEKNLAAPRFPEGIAKKVAAYKEHKAEVQSLALAGHEWLEAENGCRRLGKELTELNGAILAKTQERSALERKLRNLPRLANLARLHEELAALGEVVRLPGHYSAESRQKTVYHLEQALAAQQRLVTKLDDLAGQCAAINPPTLLLESGEQVHRLHHDLNSQQTAAKDREQLAARRLQKENDARQALKDLAPMLPLEEIEKLRLSRAELAQLRELCVEFEVKHARPQALAEDIAALGRVVAASKAQLATLPAAVDPAPLAEAYKKASRQATLPQSLAEACDRRDSLFEDISRQLTQLGYGHCDENKLAEIAGESAPSPETIDRFDNRFRALEQDEKHLADRLAENKAEQERLLTELDSLHRGGHLVSEEELVALRTERDEQWLEIKTSWLDGTAPKQEPPALAAAFASGIAACDEAGDRLRREAAQVQQAARLQAEKGSADRRRHSLAEEQKKLATDRNALVDEWRSLWRSMPVAAASPGEMRGWLGKREKTLAAIQSFVEANRSASALTDTIAALSDELRVALTDVGERGIASEGHADLVDRAEVCLERLARQNEERKRLHETLATRLDEMADREERLQREQKELAAWQAIWRQAVRKLPVTAENVSPSQVTAVIERLDALFADLDEVKRNTVRIKAIDKNRQEFAQNVATLAGKVAPDLAEKSDAEAIILLQQRLTRADKEADLLAALEKQSDEARKEKEKNDETIDKARTFLASLCREAGCTDHQALPAIEQRWQSCQRIEEEISRLKRDVLNDGGGLSLAQISSEVAGLDADQLEARIKGLDDDLKELNRQKDAKTLELGATEEQKRRMDGNDRAARAAEQAALIGAEVGRAVHRYLRVKMAGALLRRRIEEHRRRSQSPILVRANAFFKRISLGGFSELDVDFEGDQQILVGVRANGNKVRVEEMSDGTRDQLYLALRLAYLDHELDESNREPMPLVLDDILMNFDDARSRATLEVLAELSDKTQIIYFTHHQHLLELVKGVKQVQLHALDQPSTPARA